MSERTKHENDLCRMHRLNEMLKKEYVEKGISGIELTMEFLEDYPRRMKSTGETIVKILESIEKKEK